MTAKQIPATDSICTRQVSPHVRTCRVSDGQVLATYSIELRDVDPHRTPVYGRLRLVGKEWRCGILIQALAVDEIDALEDLCSTLLDLDIGAAPEVLDMMDVREAWSDWQALPWEQQPLGLRASKPRRHRIKIRDPRTGKEVKVYSDTMQRSAAAPPMKPTPKSKK